MDRKDVLAEPCGSHPDTSPETRALLTAYCDHFHTENTGGSAVDGAALHRNEQDGKNIVHKTSLHFLSEYSMQEIMGRCMITSLKTNDN